MSNTAAQVAFAVWAVAFQAAFAACTTAVTKSAPARRHRGRWPRAVLWSGVRDSQRPCPTSAARRPISTVAINSPKPALLKTGKGFSSSKGARIASIRDQTASRGRESSGKAMGSSNKGRDRTRTPYPRTRDSPEKARSAFSTGFTVCCHPSRMPRETIPRRPYSGCPGSIIHNDCCAMNSDRSAQGHWSSSPLLDLSCVGVSKQPTWRNW